MVTDDGAVRLVDGMPPRGKNHDQPCLVRRVEGVSGSVEIGLRWVLRFAYADVGAHDPRGPPDLR